MKHFNCFYLLLAFACFMGRSFVPKSTKDEGVSGRRVKQDPKMAAKAKAAPKAEPKSKPAAKPKAAKAKSDPGPAEKRRRCA